MTALEETLGNAEWMATNRDELRRILPETWTHVQNLNGLGLGLELKCIGVDWRSESEFAKVMIYLERVGIMQRDGLLVRRSPC